MDYERVNWENLPSTKTPVKADNLNKMDAGIKDLETELSKKANTTDISKIKEEITALQTENSRLKGITNALPKISGEDTSLTLTNTANAPLSDIILKGNTSQQKYSGINLLNNDIDNTTQNGITIQHDDNSVTINGTNTGKAFRRDFKNNITFKANTNYTVYIKVISGNFKPFNSNVDWAAMFFIKNNSITIDNKSSNFIMNFTPTEDNEVLPYFWFGWYSNSVQGQGSIFNNFKLQIMIVEGNYTSSTIPSYEPYVGGTASPNPDYPQEIKVVTGNNTITISNSDNTEKQELPISLGSIELCKIGDYQDYFYKSGSKWYLHKEIGKVVLDGSENWKKSSSSANDVFVGNNVLSNNASLTNRASSIANYFTYNQSVTITNKFYFIGDKKTIAIIFTAFGNTTLEQFIAWLSAHNTSVYYIKENSTNIEITDTTLISQLNELEKAVSYDDTTNISQTNANLPFYINAEAFKKIS